MTLSYPIFFPTNISSLRLLLHNNHEQNQILLLSFPKHDCIAIYSRQKRTIKLTCFTALHVFLSYFLRSNLLHIIMITVRLKAFPATLPHKIADYLYRFTLIKIYQKLFKFRYILFGNNKKSFSVGNQIVVCKNYGCPFVSVRKNLCLHAIQSQFNRYIHSILLLQTNFINPFHNNRFYPNRRNISASSDCHGNTSDASSIIGYQI